MKLLSKLWFICACLIVVLASANCFAADRFNLLVMGDDSDTDSVPAKSRIFKGVVTKLNSQMNDAGFDVYEEMALIPDGYFIQGERRNDKTLFSVARTIERPPIDVIVLFSIYARFNNKGYTNQVIANVQGRLLHLQTGKFLDSFEMDSPRNWNAPPNCNRECVLETVGKYSKILAQDVGAVLALKLACLSNESCDAFENNTMATDYELQFIGFNSDNMTLIEQQLIKLKGYVKLRPGDILQNSSAFFYGTTMGSGQLNSEIHSILKRHSLKSEVMFKGNIIKVTRQRPKGEVVFKPVGNKTDW